MDVTHPANLLEEESEVVPLGETGELPDIVEANIHNPLRSRTTKGVKELPGGLLGSPQPSPPAERVRQRGESVEKESEKEPPTGRNRELSVSFGRTRSRLKPAFRSERPLQE
jgi:hypothetical protein